MHGYTGRILRVDLSAGRVAEATLQEEWARALLGGSGLAARYLAAELGAPGRLAEVDPLGPENPLILMTGPLVGTIMPSAGRYSLCALSPLTGILGEANSGGFFGPELRFAGYDGLVITGRADRPLWLSIAGDRPALHEAGALWGLDTYATQEEVRRLLGQPRARVACVGLAGERRGKMAAVINDHGRAAARCGLGAVMGAKGLKAIAVCAASRGAPVSLADAAALRAAVGQINAALKEDVASTAIRLAGTAGYVDMALMYGDLPARYYQQGEWEAGGELSGVLMAERYTRRALACYRCPIGCGRETQAPSYGVEVVDGPEYETVGALGALNLVSDLEAVIYAGHLCNLYGLDTISTGATIALACELQARGLLSPADADGLALRYGDPALLHRLIGMIARREGLGDLLAEGSAALAAHCGAPELAATVRKLEVPLHDPRAFAGMAVTYALSSRGACHMQGDMYGVDTGQGAPLDLGVVPGERFECSEEKGRIAARQHLWRTVYNGLILCQFQNPGLPLLLEALNAVTGWGLDGEALMAIGRRTVAYKRRLNALRGLRAGDDRLPPLLLQPLPEGGTEGHVPDLAVLLPGAYAELGWDAASGMPSPDTLRHLGLPADDAARASG